MKTTYRLEEKLVRDEASDFERAKAFVALAEKFETALREILDGSKCTGRWLNDETHECPNDDDHQNPEVDHPGCTWEAYDGEEQDIWIASVAYTAAKALETQLI